MGYYWLIIPFIIPLTVSLPEVKVSIVRTRRAEPRCSEARQVEHLELRSLNALLKAVAAQQAFEQVGPWGPSCLLVVGKKWKTEPGCLTPAYIYIIIMYIIYNYIYNMYIYIYIFVLYNPRNRGLGNQASYHLRFVA